MVCINYLAILFNTMGCTLTSERFLFNGSQWLFGHLL